MVRPLLEYSPTVWGPHPDSYKKGIKQIEQVQRRAARWVMSRHGNRSSPTEMIAELGWDSLEKRRQDQRLTMVYKMSHGLVAANHTEYMTPETRQSRHVHNRAFVVPTSNADYHRCSFFPRAIREWNSLPQAVVDSPSVETFRARLGKC